MSVILSLRRTLWDENESLLRWSFNWHKVLRSAQDDRRFKLLNGFNSAENKRLPQSFTAKTQKSLPEPGRLSHTLGYRSNYLLMASPNFWIRSAVRVL
ncbi:hypothetical protein SAMN02745146_2695 [Hymenobacter daecheongensis DSM 21074]|uniref:Uncharacterized protein n=1 Tax=Hymenobacter daecheongensis DSM 21074 TaxID=1121955 RepID=A0A1M6HY32_9BACT|nr:hypothetical protein SAMN02745146_2695 [Hymenobacter daecheongensis DSM 21074]